jgi:hypothetical protein
LNFMEISHARLASLARNFVVKYADDATFDYESYTPVDQNPNKAKFFRIYRTDNERLQHLLIMTRFIMLEQADGPTELKDSAVSGFIDERIVPDGIGNDSYENDPVARRTLTNLRAFYEIFKNDPMIDENTGIKELSREYVMLSLYLLLRHLRAEYAFEDVEQQLYRQFFIGEFYPRWKKQDESDTDVMAFSNSRQMDQRSIEERDQIIRQMFFEFIRKQGHELREKDSQRAFSEEQKIAIYRKARGLCVACLEEGKTEKEATVSWKEYEADHILPHVRGGQTATDNGQVLCRHHNRGSNCIKVRNPPWANEARSAAGRPPVPARQP